MKIGFIGAGKVGTTLAMAFVENGLEVSGFWSRSAQSAAFAAGFTATQVFSDIASLVRSSDVLFITVTDDAIQTIYDTLTQLPLNGKVICHTSGVYSVEDVFPNRTAYGALGMGLHPLYPIHDKTTVWRTLRNSSFTIEGDSEATYQWVKILRDIHLDVKVIASTHHATKSSASLASNFYCALVEQSLLLMRHCGFSEHESLTTQKPRMLANLDPMLNQGTEALTRPIEGNDVDTVEKHLSTLTCRPARQRYAATALACIERAMAKHPTRDYGSLKNLLSQYA